MLDYPFLKIYSLVKAGKTLSWEAAWPRLQTVGTHTKQPNYKVHWNATCDHICVRFKHAHVCKIAYSVTVTSHLWASFKPYISNYRYLFIE